MIKKEIKKAILDIVKGSIDTHNYGMCSRYNVSPTSYDICRQNNICITRKLYGKDTITQAGVVVGTIQYRYAMRKRNGMYKMLAPEITYIG